MAADNEYYVEKRGPREWAVQRKDAERASAILPTQAQAIAWAKELAPDRRPHVERSEYTNNGKPGRFRK
jgi:Uncharacterized protein conserved in bacteria (DUF2188)